MLRWCPSRGGAVPWLASNPPVDRSGGYGLTVAPCAVNGASPEDGAICGMCCSRQPSSLSLTLYAQREAWGPHGT